MLGFGGDQVGDHRGDHRGGGCGYGPGGHGIGAARRDRGDGPAYLRAVP
ncbi:MAG: hypothetical protein M3Z75_23070 [Actinomycetota bacterium]|nr:hypothetical protein [Actinomycetota bacterium]